MNEVTVNAAEQGIVDLDEYSGCARLQAILSGQSAQSLQRITLNLERCWIEYSHAHLFLDEALRLLLESDTEGEKLLMIKTSINLGAPEFMAVFVFRLSKTLGCEANDNPATVLERVRNFCKDKQISIIIHANPFPDKPDDMRNQEFILGNPN